MRFLISEVPLYAKDPAVRTAIDKVFVLLPFFVITPKPRVE